MCYAEKVGMVGAFTKPWSNLKMTDKHTAEYSKAVCLVTN